MDFLGIILVLAFIIIVSMIVANRFGEYHEMFKKNRGDFWIATIVCLFFVIGVATVLTSN